MIEAKTNFDYCKSMQNLTSNSHQEINKIVVWKNYIAFILRLMEYRRAIHHTTTEQQKPFNREIRN